MYLTSWCYEFWNVTMNLTLFCTVLFHIGLSWQGVVDLVDQDWGLMVGLDDWCWVNTDGLDEWSWVDEWSGVHDWWVVDEWSWVNDWDSVFGGRICFRTISTLTDFQLLRFDDWSMDGVNNWGGVNERNAMVVRTFMKEKLWHSKDTLTLSRLELSGAQHGLIDMKWRLERAQLGQHEQLLVGQCIRR